MWGPWQNAAVAATTTVPPPQPAVPPPLPDAPPPPPPSDASAGAPSSNQPAAGGEGNTSAAFNPYSSGQATGAGNPYEQYTAAQYAAMTPEQQYALQHHWQQWQTYQAEYAKWHAQYGEQYKREMAAAAAGAANPTVQGVPAPAVAGPTPAPVPAVAVPGPQAYPVAQNYYQGVTGASPVPPTTTVAVAGGPPVPGKITAQPQMYNQPPPPPSQKGGYNQHLNSNQNDNHNQSMWPGPPSMQQPPPNRYGGGPMNQMSYNSAGPDNQGFPNLQQPPPSLQRPTPQQQPPPNNMDHGQWGNNNQHGAGNNNRPPWDTSGPPPNNSGQPNRWNGPPPPPNDVNNRWNGPPFNNNTNDSNRRWDGSANPAPSGGDQPQNRWQSEPPPSVQNPNQQNPNQNRWLSGPPPNINDPPQDYQHYHVDISNSSQIPRQKRWQGINSDIDTLPIRVNNKPNSFHNSWGDGGGDGNQNQNQNKNPFIKNSHSDFGPDQNSGNNNHFGQRPGNYGNSYNNLDQSSAGGSFNTNRRQSNRWENNRNQGFLDERGGGDSGPGGYNQNRGNFSQRNSFNQSNQQNRNQQQPTDLDEASFDRLFDQWEQQFEDWKRVNANHPDRDEYRRYEEEFEKQRRRIAERREQMRRRRQQQMGGSSADMPNAAAAGASNTEMQQPNNDPFGGGGGGQGQGNFADQGPRPGPGFGDQGPGSGPNFGQGNRQSGNHGHFEKENRAFESAGVPAFRGNRVPPPGMHNQYQAAQQAIQQTLDKQPEDSQETPTKSATLNENLPDGKMTITPAPSVAPPIASLPSPEVTAPAAPVVPDPPVVPPVVPPSQPPPISANLGKRRQTTTLTATIAKQVKAEEPICTISLDDDDDEEEDGEQAKPDTPMGSFFKKNDGIPGLDLVADGSGKNDTSSVFDVGLKDSDETKATDASAKHPDKSSTAKKSNESLSNALKDPNFINNLSQAVANVQEREQRDRQEQPEEQDPKADGRPLSFAEWQRKKKSNNENKSHDSRDSMSTTSGERPENSATAGGFGPGLGPGVGPGHRAGSRPGFGPGQNNGSRTDRFAPNQVLGNNFIDFDDNGPLGRNFGPNGPGPRGHNFGPNFAHGPGGPGGPFFGPNGPGPGPNFGPNFRPNGPNFGPGPGFRNYGPRGPDGPFGPRRDDFGGPPFGGPGPHFGPNGPGPNMRGFNGGPNSDNPFRRQGGPPGPGFGDDDLGAGPPRGPRNFGNRNSFGNHGGGGGQNNRKNRNDGPEKQEQLFHGKHNQNEHIYRPMKVFDYSNNATAAKVIDYGHLSGDGNPIDMPAGHRPVDRIPEFRPVKTFEYGHSSFTGSNRMGMPGGMGMGGVGGVGGDPNQVMTGGPNRGMAAGPGGFGGPGGTGGPGNKRKNKKQNKQQRKEEQLKFGQNQQFQSNSVEEPSSTNPEQADEGTQNEFQKYEERTDLEDISDNEDALQTIDCDDDNEDLPPAPPPPPPPPSNNRWNQENGLEQCNQNQYNLFPANPQHHQLGDDSDKLAPPPAPTMSLFPSATKANEKINEPMTDLNLETCVPTNENCNTISVDEVLLNPGRLTRPKRICIILRGPPGCGKSHVARLIKEKELEMGGANPRILSIDDYFLIENEYNEKCPKTGKKTPKKEILYEYEDSMEETYMQFVIKSFKRTLSEKLYDFIIVDCNNNSLRTLNEFYCHAKDSNFMPYIVDLHCDLETCLGRNSHQRTENEIRVVLDNWCTTPLQYIKLDVSSLLENVVEMEDVEDMATDDNACAGDGATVGASAAHEDAAVVQTDDSNSADASNDCGFLKSKWERDTTEDNLARLDGTKRLMQNRRTASMADYLQLEDWKPPTTSANGKKRVRWADIEEKRSQEKMRAIGFVVGQTDWNRMMDPNAGSRALNKTKYIERIKRR